MHDATVIKLKLLRTILILKTITEELCFPRQHGMEHLLLRSLLMGVSATDAQPFDLAQFWNRRVRLTVVVGVQAVNSSRGP